MTTYYEVQKLKYLCFAKEIKYVSDERLRNSVDYKTFMNDDFKPEDHDFFTLIVDSESSDFNDIDFEIDKEHEGESNKNNKTQDVMSGQLLGSSVVISAFNDEKFVIIPGKKNANIQNQSDKYNNEILDSLAVNGLLMSPHGMIQYSVGRMVQKLTQFNSFAVIILNKNLMTDKIDCIYPSILSIPSYIIGKGEILTVFYRYLILTFFGYQSVHDEADREIIYDV